MEFCTERGNIDGAEIPAGRYWGAQTERSRRELPSGAANEAMPREIIRAFGVLKKAAARANFDLLPGQMDEEKCAAIFAAADEIIRGRLADEFPLAVWQTGSGRKTNVNVNEVVARRGSEMANEPALHLEDGGETVGGPLLSPDDVNLSQPAGGAFSAAAHIAAALALEERLLPAVDALLDALARSGDHTALSRESVARDRDALRGALAELYSLTLGGAETGTPEGYAAAVAAEVSKQTGKPFVAAEADASGAEPLGGLLAAHGAMRSLAADLMSLAETLCAAPCSEGTDPALCERLEIAAVQVMGNDAALGFAAAQEETGAEEFLPVCAYNFLQSARLLSESIASFASEQGDEEG